MREPEVNIVERLKKMLRPCQLTVTVMAKRTRKGTAWITKVMLRNPDVFELVEAGTSAKSATWKVNEKSRT